MKNEKEKKILSPQHFGGSQTEVGDVGIAVTGWLLKHFIDLHMNNRLAAYWKGLELEPSWQGGMCTGVVLRWPLCHTVKGPILHKNIFTMFSGRNKKVYIWPQGSSLDSWESIFYLFIYFCIYFLLFLILVVASLFLDCVCKSSF